MCDKWKPAGFRIGFLLSLLLLGAQLSYAGPSGEVSCEEDILAEAADAGLIVHAGCGDGRLTAALHRSDGCLVQGLERDRARLEEARRHVRSLGLYGKVSVRHWSGRRLPYADNLVNLLVCEDPGRVTMDEVMRVLCPRGVAYLKRDGRWTRTVKRWPKQIDDWTHAFYGPDGNPVSEDSRVGPPRHLQWMAGPTFSRHHDTLASVSSMVSAGGRVYYIVDEGPTSLLHYPGKWFLVARDGFNGVTLWKRRIHSWHDSAHHFREGPYDLPRRLVAVDDRVYVTLGIDGSLSVLDAATGETIRTYKGTKGTEEILCHRDRLYLVVGDRKAEKRWSSAKRRGEPVSVEAKAIVALDPRSGNILWNMRGEELNSIVPQTLAVAGNRVFFHNEGKIFCLDRRTGQELWATARKANPRSIEAIVGMTGGYGPRFFRTCTLVVHDDVVLSATSNNIMAFSVKSGKKLWEGKCSKSFHTSPDVFVIDDLVWAGTGKKPYRESQRYLTLGRDLHTGEVSKKIDVSSRLWAHVAHHRCHRSRATERFMLTSMRGMEFIDLHGDTHVRNDWARGACQYGIMPANGLVYAPPHACGCFVKGKINGLFALAPESDRGREGSTSSSDRLLQGPAYKALPDEPATDAAAADGWPTYRHDPMRSAATDSEVPTDLERIWQAKLGGRLTTLVQSGGKVLVAERDKHTVYALDDKDGTEIWSFTAGGRVDSPPTIHGGLALFGSADGHVYCLRASDGGLVWRFRGAPRRRSVVSRGQIESTWPIHGSILVKDDVAYFAAGRSSYLDGGIYLYGLEVDTGRQVCRTRLRSPHFEPPEVTREEHIKDAAIPDVFVTDGNDIYMRMKGFDEQLNRISEPRGHLFAVSGLLDDSWFYRSLWYFDTGLLGGHFSGAKSYYRNRPYKPGERKPPWWFQPVSGQLLAFRGGKFYGVRASYNTRGWEKKMVGTGIFKREGTNTVWRVEAPVQFRAITLASDRLFLAGWPDVIDPRDPLAAPEGRKGGLLWVVSPTDGAGLAEYRLDASPVFDGMVAANGRLYLSDREGRVTCMGKD